MIPETGRSPVPEDAAACWGHVKPSHEGSQTPGFRVLGFRVLESSGFDQRVEGLGSGLRTQFRVKDFRRLGILLKRLAEDQGFRSLRFNWLGLKTSWTPKVCRIMAFFSVLGHYFTYFQGLGCSRGVPYFGVLRIGILLFRVLHQGPLFPETPNQLGLRTCSNCSRSIGFWAVGFACYGMSYHAEHSRVAARNRY